MLKLGHIAKDQITSKFLEDLHESIFNERLPSDYFKYDSCLVAQNDEDNIVSYALIREQNSELIELAWGGTCKEQRGVNSKVAMQMFTDECLKYYPAVMFQTWNKNIPMIRLGLLNGYIITGTRLSLLNEMFLIFTKKRGE
ncbi:MAG: hypothetical protein EBZ49_15350 [Proteobacteria bacterium]|nr:hypothetical protein [Pseudomonadota bacterium]